MRARVFDEDVVWKPADEGSEQEWKPFLICPRCCGSLPRVTFRFATIAGNGLDDDVHLPCLVADCEKCGEIISPSTRMPAELAQAFGQALERLKQGGVI